MGAEEAINSSYEHRTSDRSKRQNQKQKFKSVSSLFHESLYVYKIFSSVSFFFFSAPGM